jgi:regulator of protease activity HflC (stomatin/prohibitin superfamily)
MKITRRLGIAIFSVIALLIIIMIVMVGWQTVPVGTRGVLLTMGKAEAIPLNPGLHIITPFF